MVFRMKNFTLKSIPACPGDVPAHAKGQVASSGVLHLPLVIVKYLPHTKKAIKSPTFLMVIVMVTCY